MNCNANLSTGKIFHQWILPPHGTPEDAMVACLCGLRVRETAKVLRALKKMKVLKVGARGEG